MHHDVLNLTYFRSRIKVFFTSYYNIFPKKAKWKYHKYHFNLKARTNKTGINLIILILIFVEPFLKYDAIYDFSVWLSTFHNPMDINRFRSHTWKGYSLVNYITSAGLEPVPSHSERLCMTSYYRHFSTNIKSKPENTRFVSQGLLPLKANKIGINLIII